MANAEGNGPSSTVRVGLFTAHFICGHAGAIRETIVDVLSAVAGSVATAMLSDSRCTGHDFACTGNARKKEEKQRAYERPMVHGRATERREREARQMREVV